MPAVRPLEDARDRINLPNIYDVSKNQKLQPMLCSVNHAIKCPQ